MSDDNRTRLGRGLAALIGDMADESAVVDRARTGTRRVPVALLAPNPRNPRKTFREADLEDLASSVREKGVFQPILVRQLAGASDRFEIIAGERRWRAAQRAGLHEVPIVVIEASDKESLEIAIIENVQRADLDPLEEADGYDQLMADFSYTQEDLAKVIGKSRSHVANTLRLRGLPDSVKTLVRDGALSAGHARAVIGAPNPEELAQKIADMGLSVRDAEALAVESKGTQSVERPRPRKSDKDADTVALETALSEALGMKVVINHRANGGRVEIGYRTLEQLDEICRRLQG
jgi:ParB family chromosome partitioning protein